MTLEMTYLCACNGLTETEEESQVAVNALVALKLAGSLDTLPGRRDLDEHTVLGDALGRVELNELLGLGLGGLFVKGQAGIDLGGDTAGHDLENLGSKRDELRKNNQREPAVLNSPTYDVVCRGLDEVVARLTARLCLRDSCVDDLRVGRLASSSQNHCTSSKQHTPRSCTALTRRVGGRILGLVDTNA